MLVAVRMQIFGLLPSKLQGPQWGGSRGMWGGSTADPALLQWFLPLPALVGLPLGPCWEVGLGGSAAPHHFPQFRSQTFSILAACGQTPF